MTKNEIMKEKIAELCDAVLTFNYADGAAHSVAFLTNYAGKILKKYVRAADKEYGFTILITWHYSSELDDLNLQAKIEENHFPIFGRVLVSCLWTGSMSRTA